jgi:hypothetical protein
MSTLDALPVEFLFRMELDLGEKQVMPRGPQGTRVYAQVAGGRVEGPRLKGTVAPGADWVTVRADGSAQLDVRLVITADDGAVIFMQYQGLLGSDGIPRTAPLFQAAAEQHQWLNHIQGIGIGTSTAEGVTYEVYGLR